MAVTPRDRLERELRRIEDNAIDNVFSEELADRLQEFASALDSETVRNKFIDADGNVRTYEPRSIEAYLQCLRLSAERGLDLLDTNADSINDFFDGEHDDRGLSKTTLARYQSAARAFYRYYDLGVDPDAIRVFSERSPPKHDERDMFEAEEVDALRDACDRPRDRAFLEMLIYTGQRITAIRTLRVKDVDVDAGHIYLNDEADGLKGALERGRKRPLFGARKYVRDWLQYHPRKDDPDAPLFVGDPNHWKTKLDEPWSEPGVRKHLKRIAERAGVDKPVNPHNFRHYFVTVMKRDYQLDNDTLRMLLGTAVDSDVLLTTYSHVTNSDYVEHAETALGYRDEDDRDSPMTPDTCPTCGEILDSHWKRCPACNEVFAPELKQLEAQLAESRNEAIDEIAANPLSSGERRAIRAVLSELDDAVEVVDTLDR